MFKNYARLAIGQGRVYADGLPQMNSAQFHRLCQDAGFMEPEGATRSKEEGAMCLVNLCSSSACVCSCSSGRMSTTALDVIFTRHRAANSRRLSFKDFIASLAVVAYEMGFQFEDIMETLGARTPQLLAPSETVVGRTGPTSDSWLLA